MSNLENISIHSMGLYSSWCYHKPSRILFDCGECCAINFRNEIYGVERIMLSHMHLDHIAGLPSFIGIRNSGRGDRGKPLDIYYPKDSHQYMKPMMDFIYATYGNKLSYKVSFIPIEAGFTLELTEDSYLKAFSMKHIKNGTTLGYKIVQKRNRLKPEYVGKDIASLIHSGVNKANLTESYEANEFAYCLDSSGFDYEEIRDCGLAIMDSTFLNKNDRDDLTHFTLDEVVSICKNMNVKKVVCAHISPRYNVSEIRKAFENVPSNFIYHSPKIDS